MAGISPKLPLSRGEQDGYWRLNKTVVEAIKQNFKNLVMTIPGERIMIPNFGVGLRTFLFENQGSFVGEEIKAKIMEQVEIYMPSIILLDIQYNNTTTSRNAMSIKIFYRIDPLNYDDVLDIVIE
tara:strand:+ start:484 stop:858 length:375 start_codon:yes stop_codon:yes gene_type:complete